MATITIRNVPDDLYERLKALAKRNRRSLNQEVVVQLSTAAEIRAERGVDEPFERATRFARELRESGVTVDHTLVGDFINEGRD
jgi:plasmid stability protein